MSHVATIGFGDIRVHATFGYKTDRLTGVIQSAKFGCEICLDRGTGFTGCGGRWKLYYTGLYYTLYYIIQEIIVK